jgi:hypothetical protein
MCEEMRLPAQKSGWGTSFKLITCTVQIYRVFREIDSWSEVVENLGKWRNFVLAALKLPVPVSADQPDIPAPADQPDNYTVSVRMLN